MDPRDLALSTRRSSGFWIAGATTLTLSCVSWVNQYIVPFINARLFHAEPTDFRGWWLYVGLRTPVVLFLLWTVLRFPSTAGRPDKGVEGSKNARFFDPLMGLRALACVIVLLGHFFVVVFPFTPGPIHRYVRFLLVPPPWAGVWLFFTLSGFLMGKGFAKGRYTLDEAGSRLFLRNRMLRIAPVYYACLSLVCVYRYPEIFQLKNLWMFVEICLFDYRAQFPISPNGALWSLSAEVQFYVLVPVLMVALLSVRRWAGGFFVAVPFLLVGLATAWRLWMNRLGDQPMYLWSYLPMCGNLDLFLAGMSINLLPRARHVPAQVRAWLGPILLTGGAGFYLLLCYIAFYSTRLRMEPFLAKGPALCVVFAGVFIYLAEMRGPVLLGAGWVGRFLLGVQGVGTLTYCLYVFHADVFLSNGSTPVRVQRLGVSLALFPRVMLETFAVAIFFYFAVEKPFDGRKRVSGTALVDAP